MPEVQIDPAVFNDIYVPYLSCMDRTQIMFGGSASGKSRFLAQRCVMDVMGNKRNYLICRQTARTIKTSVFAEVCRVINEWGVGHLFNINKSDFIINCRNGYQIVFIGLDDVEKVKSIVPAKGAWTDLWVEEATECEKSAIKQLFKRQRGGDERIPKRMTLSFNPVLKTSWLFQEYFSTIGWSDSQKEYKAEGIAILKTTWRDNRFLTPSDIDDLKNETDKYYFSVYSEGMWGILGHVIFRNWSVEDLSGMHDQFTNRRHGLDFGFSSDPAAMACTHYDKMRKTIYIYDELYEKGLTNDLLAVEVLRLIGNDLVTCDSAEPKSIAELRQHKVNARGAKKGKDSVLFGIQWLQQQKIIVDKGCVNAHNELSTFHWKEDAAGNPMPVPVDKNNHFIDGARYGYEDDMDNNRVKVGAVKVSNYTR